MKTTLTIIAIILGITATVQLTKTYYEVTESQTFLEEGQYAPSYIAMDDYQMLIICEHYNLEYSYEEAVCVIDAPRD
jgi:hypothetical protein